VAYTVEIGSRECGQMKEMVVQDLTQRLNMLKTRRCLEYWND